MIPKIIIGPERIKHFSELIIVHWYTYIFYSIILNEYLDFLNFNVIF